MIVSCLQRPEDFIARISTVNLVHIALTFVLVSCQQNRIHAYLSTLPPSPNYKLPSSPYFKQSLCPHYLKEVAIYGLLTIMSSTLPGVSMSPMPSWTINWTMLCGTMFVGANLFITAQGTKQWYIRRFGQTAINGKAAMGWPSISLWALAISRLVAFILPR